MTKKKPVGPPGWQFAIGDTHVEGWKWYDHNTLQRQVAGRTLDDAVACATEVERVHQLQAQGRAEQNAARADRARDHANNIQAGLA